MLKKEKKNCQDNGSETGVSLFRVFFFFFFFGFEKQENTKNMFFELKKPEEHQK